MTEEKLYDPFVSVCFSTEESRLGGVLMTIDTRDTGKEYIIEAAIKGIKKRDIEIAVKGDELIVKLTKFVKNPQQKPGKPGSKTKSAKVVGIKSYYIGPVITEKIKATFKNGVLYIRIPKSKVKKTNEFKIIKID